MILNPSKAAEVQDWISPSQVELVKVATHTEQLGRIQQRARELREAMGPRYLCHEQNRVRRLDGRTYQPRDTISANDRAMTQAA